jgi:hypothetical protein
MVGSLEQLPALLLKYSEDTVTASEKVKTMLPGMLAKVLLLAGLALLREGAVVSMVMVELSLEAALASLWASTIMPALAFIRRVPVPVQLLSVTVAPEVLMALTATVHEGEPVRVRTVIPPPPAVRVPLRAVPPYTESAKLSAMVAELLAPMALRLGLPRVTTGPPVFMV